MKRKMNRKKKVLMMTTVILSAFVLGMFFPSVVGHAASGQTYTCTVNKSYKHPVTGAIEDAGAGDNPALAQGMIDGCVGGTGLLEETDNGQCYLTIRMSQMDLTSGHSFQVQSRGGSGWSNASVTVTARNNNNGTADFRIQVPQKDCVVRGSMYVTAMGRNVVFYAYPGGFSAGNRSGMNATVVTEAPAAQQQQQAQAAAQQEQQAQQEAEAKAKAEEEAKAKAEADAKAAAEEIPTPEVDKETLDSAQGLSLSTAKDKSDVKAETAKDKETKKSNHTPVMIAVGVILVIAVAGCAVYFVKKNKNKGDTRDDDE